MAAKFVVVLALVAAGQCSVVPLAKVDTDYSSFAYDVADPNTGDFKSQVETRVGGTVSGQYSLLDSDGTKRTVDYTADDVNGFNAVVRKDPVVAVAPVVSAPVVAKTVVASPVYTASPVVKSVVSSPVYAASAPYVTARSYAPAVYAPSVYSAAAPAVYSGAAPAVYSAGVYAAAPSVYSSGVYAPSVYSSGVYAPSVYGRTVYGSPLTYSAYSAPVSYW